jgi:hypothetical protein
MDSLGLEKVPPPSLTRRAKEAVKILISSGPLASLAKSYAGLTTILMYHQISPERTPPTGFDPNIGLCVPVELFEQQVQYLSRHYRCLSLPQALDGLRAGTLRQPSVVLTIDDGYRDSLLLALPVLERYRVPATIYVTTGYVQGTASLWWLEYEFICNGSWKARLKRGPPPASWNACLRPPRCRNAAS